MKANVCYKLPSHKPVFDNRHQLAQITAYEDLHWDLHEIEAANAVTMHAHGYLLVADVNNNIFLYPTVNVLKVEVLDL